MTNYEKIEKMFEKDPKKILKYSNRKLGKVIKCASSTAMEAKRKYMKNKKINKPIEEEFKVDDAVKADIEKRHEKKNNQVIEQKYNYLSHKVEVLEKELEAALQLKQTPQEYTITPPKNEKSYSTAVMLLSDMHYEEEVDSAKVSGLNSYNLDIAASRMNNFFRNGVKMVKMSQQDTAIDTIVLYLLGDSISGNIHDDIMESCRLRPMDAIWEVQSKLISGINYILENTTCKLIVPCHVGNHTRITKDQRFANETGNSLEWLMYKSMELHYANNKRVTFMVAEGYHMYLDIYGYVIRSHHGHAIKYGGGIGGLTVPVNRAIAQWNRGKAASLDVFGHLHQFIDGGKFICNGSVIGYNAFAVAIKAEYEPARQVFFLINGKYKCKTVVSPIFLD